jgi:hypothetical protein
MTLVVVTTTLEIAHGQDGPMVEVASVKPPLRTAANPAAAAAAHCGLTQRGGQINMGGFPIDAFARVLSSLAGREVVNRTGL